MVRSKKYIGVWLRILKNLDITYYIQYKDAEGVNRKTKVGRKSAGITEQFCFNNRNDMISKIRLGEVFPLLNKKWMNFDELAQKYFVSLIDNGRSANATKISVQSYNKHLKKVLKNKSVNTIDVATLNKIKQEKRKTLAAKTVNNLLELISCTLNYGIKTLDMKINNVLAEGKVKKFPLDNNRERFLNKEEVVLLLEHTAPFYKIDIATRLGLATGARLTTILSIQKKNIDKVNRTVVLKDFKNNSTYTASLPKCYFENFDFLDTLKANDYVVSDDGAMINKSTIQHPFKKIADRLFNIGLDSNDRKNRVVFHSLRHTFCSLLAINGVPIFTIQKLVNHKDIKSTTRYTKLDNSTMFDAVQSAFTNN